MEWYLQRVGRPEECYLLKPGETVLGRYPDCTITLTHISVSRRHCRITVDNDRRRVFVEDLRSGNGVFVGGERISQSVRTQVSDGVSIGIGLPVDARFPDLEESNHYRFKLIRKASGRILFPEEEIIDLTKDEKEIKKEITDDLEEPPEIVDDDGRSFLNQDSPALAFSSNRLGTDEIARIWPDPDGENSKSINENSPFPLIHTEENNSGRQKIPSKTSDEPLCDPEKQSGDKIRSSEPPTMRKVKEAHPKIPPKKRASEPSIGKSDEPHGVQKICSEKNQSFAGTPEAKKVNNGNLSPGKRRSLRSQRLKEIAEKTNLPVEGNSKQKQIPEKSSIAAKVTAKTRGDLLLENIISTENITERTINTNQPTARMADLEDSIVLNRLLNLDPECLEKKYIKDGPITLERVTDNYSYQSYKRIMENFILYEIWNLIYASKHLIRNPSKFQMKYRVLHEIGRKDPGNVIIIRVGPTIIDKKYVPKYDDLLLVKFGNISCFAMVKTVQATVKNRGIFILELFIMCSEELLTISPKTTLYLIIMCNISHELSVMYSLYRLSNVKLCDFIVSPNIRYFSKSSYQPTLICHSVLDEFQISAVKQCMGSILNNECGLQIIQGAPGTGKTLALAHLIMEYFTNKMNHDKKVLICANSNISAQNILKEIMNARNRYNSLNNLNLLLVARPENVKVWALNHCFPKKKQQSTSSNVIPEENSKDEDNNRLLNSNVIVTNLVRSSKLYMLKDKVAWGFIDDASSSIEVDVLTPIALNIPLLVLAGDVRQQPIRLMSEHSENNGFMKSLFTRIAEAFPWKDNFPVVLENQHRMNPDIFEWPNKRMYGGQHTNKKRPSNKTPSYKVLLLPEINNNMNTEQIIRFCVGRLAWAFYKHLDTIHFETEIIILCQHSQIQGIQQLIGSLDIERPNRIEVFTFENYQGCESSFVLLAPLLNPTKREMNAFFNIGLTRARECLLVCCLESMAKINEKYQSLIQDANGRHVLSRVPYFFYDAPNINTISDDIKFIKRLLN